MVVRNKERQRVVNLDIRAASGRQGGAREDVENRKIESTGALSPFAGENVLERMKRLFRQEADLEDARVCGEDADAEDTVLRPVDGLADGERADVDELLSANERDFWEVGDLVLQGR